MKLNVHAVLQREAEKAAMVKPLPKIKVKNVSGSRSEVRSAVTLNLEPQTSNLKPQTTSPDFEKATVLKELYDEMRILKKERAKLSSSTASLVLVVHERLQKESPAKAIQFTDGMMAVHELETHAGKIDALTTQIISVWDKIRHVDQYGKMPAERAPIVIDNNDSEEVKSLQTDIRRLGQNISKTMKKLETGKPLNIQRKALWNEKIALMEGSLIDKKHKLKKLQYDARAQRISEQ